MTTLLSTSGILTHPSYYLTCSHGANYITILLTQRLGISDKRIFRVLTMKMPKLFKLELIWRSTQRQKRL